jgi:hypothetical protein
MSRRSCPCDVCRSCYTPGGEPCDDCRAELKALRNRDIPSCIRSALSRGCLPLATIERFGRSINACLVFSPHLDGLTRRRCVTAAVLERLDELDRIELTVRKEAARKAAA